MFSSIFPGLSDVFLNAHLWIFASAKDFWTTCQQLKGKNDDLSPPIAHFAPNKESASRRQKYLQENPDISDSQWRKIMGTNLILLASGLFGYIYLKKCGGNWGCVPIACHTIALFLETFEMCAKWIVHSSLRLNGQVSRLQELPFNL